MKVPITKFGVIRAVAQVSNAMTFSQGQESTSLNVGLLFHERSAHELG